MSKNISTETIVPVLHAISELRATMFRQVEKACNDPTNPQFTQEQVVMALGEYAECLESIENMLSRRF